MLAGGVALGAPQLTAATAAAAARPHRLVQARRCPARAASRRGLATISLV